MCYDIEKELTAMFLATTTGDFGKFFSSDKDRVKGLYEAGFRYMDLSMYSGDRPGWQYMQPDWEEQIDELKEYADNLGMTFVQAHSPGTCGNPLVHNEAYDQLVASTIRSIEICGKLGIKNTVIHTGWHDDIQYNAEGEKKYFEENMKFISALFPAMEKNGVNVLIENSTKANMGSKYFFYTGNEMRAFLAYANHPLLHACWDTGHANVEGSQYQQIVDLGEELYGLHVNDNRSGRDEHMMPYTGSLNLDEIMCALIDSNYKGYFTFECGSTLVNPGYWLCKRKEFTKETRLSTVPYFLHCGFEKLLYETGKYALEAYNCFEG